jgi:hypothetical protein
VTTGHTLTATENPSLAGTFFGVPAIGTVEATGAANFLTVTSGRLVYDADKTAPTHANYN